MIVETIDVTFSPCKKQKHQPTAWKAAIGWNFILHEHDQIHYGMAFGFIQEYWRICERLWQESGRISIAKLSPLTVGSKLILSNVYLPTMRTTNKDGGKERDTVYDVISSIMNVHKHDIILLGDFNSKVGREFQEICTGRYSRGIRNLNGQVLIDFTMSTNMFIANTAFQYSARHITRAYLVAGQKNCQE